MSADKSNPGRNFDQLVLYKWLLMWLHVFLATAAGLCYVYKGVQSNFAYWIIGASVNMMFHALTAMWPYVISWLFFRSPINLRALALWPYIILLIGSTAAVMHLYVAPTTQDSPGVGVVTVAQALLYVIGASWVIVRSA